MSFTLTTASALKENFYEKLVIINSMDSYEESKKRGIIITRLTANPPFNFTSINNILVDSNKFTERRGF